MSTTGPGGPQQPKAIRIARLARLLVSRGRTSIDALLDLQGCSKATLYRDLEVLKAAGWIVLTEPDPEAEYPASHRVLIRIVA